jgi:hypothetical protein
MGNSYRVKDEAFRNPQWNWGLFTGNPLSGLKKDGHKGPLYIFNNNALDS